ncbi:LytR/AlgR family response regulator transcription factor [Algoriphagus hitonicola]|uniref:LytTr DNA-binding domain-containing protein n=1 Tax=Algoriphagus hitonicola TaxID=435880 RepID=A0A1I2XDE4_9BACT|nr:LytTR family DNA-binding domain-containing protein [Algoriphagus hitonicola]SFH11554.1 LytTr DNA-binding domain-containing protein [Algoriphagus hitonicola]
MNELIESARRNGNGMAEKPISLQKPSDLLIRDSIFVRHDGSLVKVKYQEILWLKGNGNYTTLVTKDFELSIRNILKEFEEALPNHEFMRIHKSYIVRLEEILAINTRELRVGDEFIPIGRTYYQKLIEGIQKLGGD